MSLKPDFQVISKWSIGNVVPRGGHNGFVHPLWSLFTYPHLTDWKINIGYIIFKYMPATCALFLPQTLLL